MEFKRLVSWEQGLFLQPQHFQISDLYHEYLLSTQMRIQNPYFWGIYKCNYERTLLDNKVFSLADATIIMPDGTLLELPENAKLVPRSFADLFEKKIDTFKVFLGIKLLQNSEPNVTEQDSFQNEESNTRFVADKAAQEYPDVYYRGPAAGVKQLKYSVRIFWETEAAQLQNYILLPIAKIARNAAGAYLDETFIPPLLSLNASESLMRIVTEFSELMSGRVKQIEGLKQGANYYEQSTNQTKLLILQSLGRAVPRLLHMVNAAAVHPIQFYEMLIMLLGELSVFSTDINIAGENAEAKKVLPSYQHENLYHSINTTCNLIITALNQIVLGSQNLVQAKKEDNLYVAQINEQFFNDKQHFYLLVQAPKDSLNAVLEHVNTTAKLCAYSEMGKYLQYALPGIELKKLAATPNGVPRISDCLYFQIDKASNDWSRIEKEKKMAFYVGNLTVDLIINLAGTQD